MLIEKLGRIIKPQHRIEYISNAKAIAILAVVFLHSSSPFFYKFGEISNRAWIAIVSYDSFVRFCVPLFLIISGALILKKDYDLKDWLLNNVLKRIVLPFIFYFSLYAFILKRPLLSIFTPVSINYHFTFFTIILSIYLLYPVMRLWLKNSSTKLILYFLAVWGLLTFSTTWFPKFLWISPYMMYGYLGYPVIGYLLTKIDTKKYKWLGIIMYVVASILTALLTVLTSLGSAKPNEFYFEYTRPFVIISTIGLYVFVKNTDFKLTKNLKIVRDFISDHSYGIYFLHPLILPIVAVYFKNQRIYISNWLTFTAGFTITALIIYFATRIPLLRRIVG